MPRGKRVPDWKRDRVIVLRKEGLTTKVIAERIGMSRAFVSWVLKERGIGETRPGRPCGG